MQIGLFHVTPPQIDDKTGISLRLDREIRNMKNAGISWRVFVEKWCGVPLLIRPTLNFNAIEYLKKNPEFQDFLRQKQFSALLERTGYSSVAKLVQFDRRKHRPWILEIGHSLFS